MSGQNCTYNDHLDTKQKIKCKLFFSFPVGHVVEAQCAS
jgi:hypothetical protein